MTRLSIVTKIQETSGFGFEQVRPIRLIKRAEQYSQPTPWQRRTPAKAESTLVATRHQFSNGVISGIPGRSALVLRRRLAAC